MATNKNCQNVLLFAVAAFAAGVLAGAFVLSNLNFSLPGWMEKLGLKTAKNVLADFDQKFEAKLKANNFAVAEPSNGDFKMAVIPGKIQKVESPDFFILRATNVYRGDDIINFVLNQPDYYDIKILISSGTKITRVVFPPVGIVRVQTAPQTDKEIKPRDLKEGDDVLVALEQPIDVSKDLSARAVSVRDFGI